MRHKGNKNEYKEQQDREVWLAYRKILSIYGGKTGVWQLYGLVAFAPATRFFTSDLQALRVVKQMMNSAAHSLRMRHERRRMYSEIYNRVTEILKRQPCASLSKAVEKVLQQPAPEMYLSPRQVSAIINQQRKIRARRIAHAAPTRP